MERRNGPLLFIKQRRLLHYIHRLYGHIRIFLILYLTLYHDLLTYLGYCQLFVSEGISDLLFVYLPPVRVVSCSVSLFSLVVDGSLTR